MTRKLSVAQARGGRSWPRVAAVEVVGFLSVVEGSGQDLLMHGVS